MPFCCRGLELSPYLERYPNQAQAPAGAGISTGTATLYTPYISTCYLIKGMENGGWKTGPAETAR